MGFVPNLAIENTNIGGYHELHHTTDYNRLRADLTIEHEKYRDVAGKLIVDNETLYTSKPSSLQNKTSIYRAYLEYRGMKHFWSVGKQRIPLGVGRIWNPIDVFNPIDSEAIETDERIGTDSIRYEYAVSDLSNVDATMAKGKGAVWLKGYLDYADVGLVGLWDEDGEQDIIGWELEGQLLESGIELRSEGGSFHNRTSGERYTEFIVGAEYGFANSLTLLAEYNYSDETKIDYLGGLASYQPAMLWLCSLLLVANLDDHSGFVAPSLEYSLSDEMTLSAGAFVYNGSADDEFGQVPDRYYLRWFVHF
jgi:opacity protein-like surface antigen